MTNPDAPVSLSEDLTSKSESKIGLQWSEGAANGGDVIIDYRVSSDQATDTWVVLSSTILTTSYVAEGLTPGLTYTFRVEARNQFGYSAYSTEVELICGYTPFAPDEPTSEVRNSDVVIEWVAPAANGSPLTGYRVEI